MDEGLFAGFWKNFSATRYMSVVLFIVLAQGTGEQCGVFDEGDPMDPDPETELATLEVEPEALTFDAVGQTAALTAVGRDEEGNAMTGVDPEWASSKPSVATVSGSGVVSAAGVGSATVTASADGVVSNPVDVSVSGDGDPPGSGECTITVDDTGMPQDGVEAAGPGDVVCLVGTFTLAHNVGSTGRNGVYLVNAGTGGTIDNPAVLDGSGAVVQGDFDTPTNLNIGVGSGWVVRNFTIRTGVILVDASADGVWIEDNDIADAVVPAGNAGLIRLLGRGDPGPSNVFVSGNHLHDLYGCESSATTECTPGTAIPWDDGFDVEHHACFTIQGGGGLVEFFENVAERCPAILYFKSRKTTPSIVRDNIFRDALRLGRCRGTNMTFQNNTLENVGGEDQQSDRCETT